MYVYVVNLVSEQFIGDKLTVEFIVHIVMIMEMTVVSRFWYYIEDHTNSNCRLSKPILARSANFPTVLYVLPSLISFFNLNQIIIGYWTDFYDFFTKWKVFTWIFFIWTIFSIPQGTLPWQPILGKICEMTFIQQRLRSETDWNIAIPIYRC